MKPFYAAYSKAKFWRQPVAKFMRVKPQEFMKTMVPGSPKWIDHTMVPGPPSDFQKRRTCRLGTHRRQAIWSKAESRGQHRRRYSSPKASEYAGAVPPIWLADASYLSDGTEIDGEPIRFDWECGGAPAGAPDDLSGAIEQLFIERRRKMMTSMRGEKRNDDTDNKSQHEQKAEYRPLQTNELIIGVRQSIGMIEPAPDS
jgi:hypothetical protein